MIACGKNDASTPERHNISYPDHYATNQDEEGADEQTTEYSCGYATALMVLQHFGTENYDEMQIGELIGIDDVMIFVDPYDVTDHHQDGYYTYPLGIFFYMWREGTCTANIDPYSQPFVVAQPY